MPLSLTVSGLSSRIIRAATSPTGTRIFSLSGLSPSSSGGVLGFVWNGFQRFGGFLLGNVMGTLFAGLAWTFSAFWGVLVSLFQFVWNFNWNASDAELDAQIQAAWAGLGSVYGGALGNALGYLVCGAVPGLILTTFNEPLGIKVLETLGEQAAEEVAGNLANVIRLTSTQLVKSAMIYYYKNTRAVFREGASFIRTKLLGADNNVSAETIAKAKKTKDEPWSFASATQAAVEALPDGFIENFVEEFIEEFSDSCIESGYIIASTADTFHANAHLASIRILGSTETIEIYPSRTEFNAPVPSPAPTP